MSLCTALPSCARVCVLLGGTGLPVSFSQPVRPLAALLISRIAVEQTEPTAPLPQGSSSHASGAGFRRPILGRRIWRLRRGWDRSATPASAPAVTPDSTCLRAVSV